MILAEIGITVLGDVKHIIRCLQSATSKTEEDKKVDLSTRIKTPAEKLSQLQAEMTNPQFRKFRVDWSVFKKITNIMDNQIHAQLYNACDDSVQNSLLNTVSALHYLRTNGDDGLLCFTLLLTNGDD